MVREVPVKFTKHGFDPATKRLFSVGGADKLFALDARSGKILLEADLSGTSDVTFLIPRESTFTSQSAIRA